MPRTNASHISTSAILAALLALQACAHSSPQPVPADAPPQAPSRSANHTQNAESPQFRRISRGSGTTSSGANPSYEPRDETGSPRTAERPRKDLSISQLESRARKRELGGREYRWHERPREVHGDIDCPDVELVEYEGRVIDYNRPIEVNPAFRRRLERFERLVRDVAIEVYGRAPDRIVQRGGHTCRTIGGKGQKLSEHSFGHAIDVAGFDFDAASPSESDGLRHPRAAEAFEVRLDEHWDAWLGFKRRHRTFLRRLAATLEHRGPFSGMLGPSYPGHDEMFHFDFGPEFFFRL